LDYMNRPPVKRRRCNTGIIFMKPLNDPTDPGYADGLAREAADTARQSAAKERWFLRQLSCWVRLPRASAAAPEHRAK
jgi:hypothetical protein